MKSLNCDDLTGLLM